MTILYIDPIGGLAGDMLCAALLDLGINEQKWINELNKLGLPETEMKISETKRGVFRAKYLSIVNPKSISNMEPVNSQIDAMSHSHDHHHNTDGPNPISWDDVHRTWRDIQELIHKSQLSDGTKSRVLKVFGKLASAESLIHGQPLEDVCFHEVGAIDSILDIVGVCLALEMLGITQLLCGAPPCASGEIYTAHGKTPLPAPATLQLLKGWSTRKGYFNHEQVTPTGAAIIAALAEQSTLPEMEIENVGYGAGTRNPKEYANIVRAIIGTVNSNSDNQDIIELCCNIDDMIPEHFPLLFERLFQVGAIDVYRQPIQMKKGRSGWLLTVLLNDQNIEQISGVIFANTSTFGLRYIRKERIILERKIQRVDTIYGPASIKIGLLRNNEVQRSVEYEDALRIAKEHNLPLQQVYDVILDRDK
jgi:pyridinium-3,5-bisthiocarboxylic acid mononucleotide nickel chelatase